jgi:hypothetical protein
MPQNVAERVRSLRRYVPARFAWRFGARPQTLKVLVPDSCILSTETDIFHRNISRNQSLVRYHRNRVRVMSLTRRGFHRMSRPSLRTCPCGISDRPAKHGRQPMSMAGKTSKASTQPLGEALSPKHEAFVRAYVSRGMNGDQGLLSGLSQHQER